MSSMQVTDVFSIMMSSDEHTENADNSKKAVSDALIDCLNKFGNVDIPYIVEKTGKSVSFVLESLKGIIYQLPEAFDNSHRYNPAVGWVLSVIYLSGNVYKKLAAAQIANLRFPGKFENNIKALKSILPAAIDIDDIHLSLGATWVPAEEYSLFIAEFLNLKEPPEVTFYKDLNRWKVVSSPEANRSVLNTITYGIRDDKNNWAKQYLTAIDIIEQTMNAKTLKVFDYIPTSSYLWSGFDFEPVFNKNKTLEAQEKQKAILDGFRDWVYKKKSRTQRFEEYYNDAFVGYTFSAYDGTFLKFPELNPEVKLFKHQRDAIARILLSDSNVLLAHDVGSGKTYEMIVSVRELYRLGLSKKNLIVVPNNVLKATVDAHRHLYKDDKILAIFPKDFTPDKRNRILNEIKNGDYVAIYMAYSSFDMIVMSKQYYIDKMENRIKELKISAFNASAKHEKRALEAQIKALEKKLSKYVLEEKECPWLTFDKLGINTLVVDEAHNYKNIPIRTKSTGVVGMGGNNGSKKCREMLEKSHFVDRLIFATGTPLTNSLADLFAFQTYLQPGVLEYHNIGTFDTWINTFGQRETIIECDVDANSNSLRTMTRFSSFHNLGELMSLFSQVCDFHHIDENENGLPKFNGHIDVCVPKNEVQNEYIKGLSERTDLIRSRKVKRNEDNLLKVTTDGRKAALDIRLIDDDISLHSDTFTKIDACAEKVFKLYQTPQSVQIIFSDIGVPKDKFNVYDELFSKLTEKGIPNTEIAYVHDATTEAARAKLFSAMNKGEIRVVIGSTQKLGVGVNVQERLVAIHHLSVPWRPADMVQREGRILRKGNTSDEVFIYRYITEGSFDAYSWQLLENKQRFVSAFLSGTSSARDMSDIADAVLSYAEVKALAIGNPLIKKRVEVANQLDRMKIAGRSRQKQMQELRAVLDLTPAKVRHCEKLAEIAHKDFEKYTDVKETIPNDERMAFGEELLDALKKNILKEDERVFDTYQGFYIVLPANMTEDNRHVLIKSDTGGNYYCEMDMEKTALGCSKTIDYLLEHLNERSDKFLEQALYAKKQIQEAGADLEKDNPYLIEIEKLKSELEKIDKELEESANDDNNVAKGG